MAGYSKDTLAFMRALHANNDRDWFKAHQADYEAHVREPSLQLIEDATQWMEVAGHPYRGEAKKVGGGLSRIHRDTRFSHDKRPYHNYVFLHFHHKDAAGQPGPMIGLRFDHEGVAMGGGLYGGETATLNRVRDAIVADPDGWRMATQGIEVWGDGLKTAPKGYDKEHPLIEDIRRKAWMASVPMTEQAFTGDTLAAFQDGVPLLRPFLDWMAGALLD